MHGNIFGTPDEELLVDLQSTIENNSNMSSPDIFLVDFVLTY